VAHLHVLATRVNVQVQVGQNELSVRLLGSQAQSGEQAVGFEVVLKGDDFVFFPDKHIGIGVPQEVHLSFQNFQDFLEHFLFDDVLLFFMETLAAIVRSLGTSHVV